MDRRQTFQLLTNRRKKTSPKVSPNKTKKTNFTVSGSFDPYTGPWEFKDAAHLLRRTIFGPTKVQIEAAVADGLAATIQRLFSDQPLPAPPIYYDFNNDPNAGLGETWINSPDNQTIPGMRNARRRSLFAWTFINLQESGVNIREKMTLFWHNHFVVANTTIVNRTYYYYNFLRENALGNFRTLVEGITIDPSMLIYLNGTQNTANGPNENYARELLELFTIGKGEPAGPGDYTNYTEEDVIEMARALTGWRSFNIDSPVPQVLSSFTNFRHDDGTKQLSHRFDNAIINNEGDQEYKTVIDHILQKDEVARFISRKMYRWFVHTDITDEVETSIIEPMAQMIIADEYEIQRALETLLSSAHFFDLEIRGCMMAHPVDHWFKLVNTLELDLPEELATKYRIHRYFYAQVDDSEMKIFFHPNVAGWKAFYQAPQFDKIWINSVSLTQRQRSATRFISGFNDSGFRIEIDVLAFVAALDNPTDPNDLIREIADIIFVQPLTDEQVAALKEVIIPGLPDFEWTVEYGDYASGNTELEEAVENKLKSLFGIMTNMPEFHLI